MDVKDFYFALHRQGSSTVTFMPARLDEGVDPEYYGFISESGSWMIMRKSQADGTIKYCFGKTDFHTHWDNRSALTYYWFDEALRPENFAG